MMKVREAHLAALPETAIHITASEQHLNCACTMFSILRFRAVRQAVHVFNASRSTDCLCSSRYQLCFDMPMVFPRYLVHTSARLWSEEPEIYSLGSRY